MVAISEKTNDTTGNMEFYILDFFFQIDRNGASRTCVSSLPHLGSCAEVQAMVENHFDTAGSGARYVTL
jgi:hypothetical protein